jgi:hypothetical protein
LPAKRNNPVKKTKLSDKAIERSKRTDALSVESGGAGVEEVHGTLQHNRRRMPQTAPIDAPPKREPSADDDVRKRQTLAYVPDAAGAQRTAKQRPAHSHLSVATVIARDATNRSAKFAD